MARIHFKKDGEPSTKKNYIPESKKVHKFRKIWKTAFIVSGIVNVLCISFIANKYFHFTFL